VLLEKATLHPARGLAALSAALVLLGGVVLRYVFVYAGQMSSFE
jgi:formate-dependent nitrite reductase membrane component NrfD